MGILNRGKAIFFLMIFEIVLFAGIGRVAFLDSPVEDNFFNGILTGWYGLFVL